MNRQRPSQYSYRGAEAADARRRLVLATGLVVALFLADLVTGGMIRNLIRSGTGLVWGIGARIERSVAGTGFVSSRTSLAAQNEVLRSQLAQYESRVAAASVAVAENELLRGMAQLAAHTPGITAPITSSLKASPYGTFFVGAGAADGIVHGTLVLSGSGYVLGRISDVGTHSALVDQLFAPGNEIDGLASGVSLTLVGEGGGNAVARAPRGAAISVGDVVFSPSLGSRPIAIVGSVAADPADAYTLVFVRTPANIAALQFVYIVTGE